MTHEELIEKCQAAAHAVVKDNYFIDAKMKITTREMTAAILSTILTEVLGPSEAMTDASRHLMFWLTGGRPTEHSLKFLCERRGLPVPDGCEDVHHVPPKAQQAAWVWQAMLNASPLAGEKRGAE